jgi:hydrogenase maturation protein HypF
MYGDDLFTNPLPLLANFSRQELRILHSMLRQGLNSPHTSSAGRLFDAVAALLGLRNIASFEGQAAMLLEFAADWVHCDGSYDFRVNEDGLIDWQPMIEKLLLDIELGVTTPVIAARFHNTLAEMIVAIAQRTGEQQVALTGGCFQNRYLTERTIQRLREAGFTPLWHRRIPPNDGGIAVGQVLAAARQLQEKKTCV